jgi:hypothetical protein
LADTNTDILVSENWISVMAILVSVSVSATLDIGYIGIGKILVKIHGYRPEYQHISVKILVIGKISAKMKISVSVSLAEMLVQIYLYRYRLGEYIGISIGWTHIGPTLICIDKSSILKDSLK